MSVHLDKCTNDRCGHLFEVEQFSKSFGDGLAHGMIECPYCGTRKNGDARLIYISRKLIKEIEEWCSIDRPASPALTPSLPLHK
ncbi:hypothetical protein [Noviherbaspirillum sp. Root189]|uniref:hypothetical protein n=1 Tax=Noviherbaspirillum sp. Root189 TaxID=1736487 RepID=UPI0012E3D8D7|nr:hypothetical protein [Noviherbaspirillum sp. Root189]